MQALTSLLELDTSKAYLINSEWRNDMLDVILPFFSETIILVICLLVFLFFYWKNLKQNGKSLSSFYIFFFLLVISLGINNIISDIIKDIADRPRPYQALPNIYYHVWDVWYSLGEWKITLDNLNPQGGSSFLSSHASNSMTVAMVFYLYFRKSSKLIWLIFLLPFIVSWSRIYLGKHYPLDVTAGCILGAIVTYCMYKLFNKYIIPKYSK